MIAPRYWRRPLVIAWGQFPTNAAGAPTIDQALADGLSRRADVIMMAGPLPARSVLALRAWAVPAAGWDQIGSHTGDAKQLRITYRHRATGRRIDLYRASAWFGEDCTADVAAGAWGLLARRFAEEGWPLYPTPGTTGRLALANIWHEQGVTYPPTTTAGVSGGFEGHILGDVIRSTSGQGRVELFGAAELGADQLHKADGRFMYADLARAELGVGEPHHVDDGHDPDPMAFGRYRVIFSVPDFWRHVGLVGVRIAGRPRPLWPCRPGEGADHAWIDGCELAMLRNQGWPVRVREGWEWPQRARPLRAWADRLIAMRERSLAIKRAAPGEYAAFAAAVRAVTLHTIGALHGRPRLDEGEVSDPGLIPSDAVGWWYDRHQATWRYRVPAEQRSTDLAHPEWSAHIWARARVRLAIGTKARPFGLLWLDPEQLVACELDAIYTNSPSWAMDDGHVGTFRHVASWSRPWQRFGSLHELHTYTGEDPL